MTRHIAIQMDDPAHFNAATDSTIMLALEAQKRGYELYYYKPDHLTYTADGLIATQSHPITFADKLIDYYKLGEKQSLSLDEMDAVLMRQDPPYDMAYLSATYLLEQLNVPVVNDPTFVRNAPEKLSILHFPELIPPTIVSRDEEAILDFLDMHNSIIVKPLYGYGGRSIYKFDKGDSNLITILEQFKSTSGEPLMIQAFLPEVSSEDRRIIMMDGKVSAVVGRIPADGEIRANFRVGGSAAKASLSEKQQQICDTAGKWLHENGITFAGLDLIGDYLTEINITSPTGLRAAQELYGINAAVDFWNAVEEKF